MYALASLFKDVHELCGVCIAGVIASFNRRASGLHTVRVAGEHSRRPAARGRCEGGLLPVTADKEVNMTVCAPPFKVIT